MHIPPAAKEALKRLYEEHLYLEYGYKGAVGRGGVWLMKHGLAVSHGRTVYAAGAYKELPFAWVQYSITDRGIEVAKEIFTIQNGFRKVKDK